MVDNGLSMMARDITIGEFAQLLLQHLELEFSGVKYGNSLDYKNGIIQSPFVNITRPRDSGLHVFTSSPPSMNIFYF